MASSYPAGLDVGFPGWPYVDDTEYVTAEQANSWIAAIQAIETAIGYGIGTGSPLYSTRTGQTYSTVSARIAESEAAIAGAVQIDTSAADIQPIGTQPSAGNSGKAADAKHVHSGVPPNGLISIGEVTLWPGSAASIPASKLPCNGQQVFQSAYPTLFGILGNTWGPITGGMFYLPPYNDRFIVGVGSVIATQPGQTGGSQNISTAQLPPHSHSGTDLGHTHGMFVNGLTSFSILVTDPNPSTLQVANPGGVNVTFNDSNQISSGTANISIGSAGGGQPYTPPWAAGIWVIRAL